MTKLSGTVSMLKPGMNDAKSIHGDVDASRDGERVCGLICASERDVDGPHPM